MEDLLKNQSIANKEFEKPELSLKDYIFIIRRGLSIIVVSVILFLFASVYYTFSENPVYQASSTILIDKPERMDALFGMGTSGEMTEIANVTQLIQSRRLAIEVVKKLWNSPHRNNLELFGTEKYRHRGQRPRRMIKEIITLGQYERRDDAPKKYNEPYSDSIGIKFSESLLKKIKITSKRQTDLLVITTYSSFPEEAALIANSITNVFKRLDQEWKSEESLNIKEFLIHQLNEKESELVEAEDILRKYQEDNQVYSLDGNAESILAKSIETESSFYESSSELNIKNQEKEYILSRLSDEEKSLVEQLKNSINVRLLTLRTELGNLEAELVRNAGIHGDEHEAVSNLRMKISQLKSKLDSETRQLLSQGLSVVDPIQYRQELISQLVNLEAQIVRLTSRSKEYEKLVHLYDNQLNELPKKQLEYARLERDRSVLSEIYGFMRTKLEETRISVASEVGTIRIIDSAIVPTKPVSPNHANNIVLGMILGIGFGLALIFLKEYLDHTVRSADYIEKLGLTILGVIPEVGQEYIRKKKNANSPPKAIKDDSVNGLINSNRYGKILQRRMVTREDPKSPVSEAYRMLRTNILYSKTDGEVETILVSSPGPGEGKSTTVTNLAITFANLEKKTLLVDVDLRKPVVHRMFTIDRDPGMSHYLSGHENNIDKLVHKTEIENLSVITAGISPPNPSELLGSDRMTRFVEELKNHWDVILFDSPPIVAVTDATTLSQILDSMVLVVKAGVTPKDSFLRALSSLKKVKTTLTGVVLNSVSKTNTYDSYYYYYQQDYYYIGSSEND